MKNFGKILILTMVLVMTLSLFTMVFATENLNDWKEGTTEAELGDLDETVKSTGLSIDNLIQLLFKVAVSIVVGWIGLKVLFGNDAKGKTEIKAQLVKVFLASIIAFFGISILQKVLDMTGGAIF